MPHAQHRTICIGFLLVGIGYSAVVAIAVTPYRAIYFGGDLFFWWMPQLFTLGALLLFKPPIALLAGAAFSLGTLPFLVQVWTHFPMGWIGYLLCTGGAFVGAVLGAMKTIIHAPVHPKVAATYGFSYVSIGILVNIALLEAFEWALRR
jgi:hypothetical protein